MTQTIPGRAARDGVSHVLTRPETVSGGHLAAKASTAGGVDLVYTRRGGHVIDIGDGCTDEVIAVLDVRHVRLAAHVTEGYAHGSPGPSFPEIPRDVLDAAGPPAPARLPQPGSCRTPTRTVGNPTAAEQLADLVARSEKPYVPLGSRVRTGRAAGPRPGPPVPHQRLDRPGILRPGRPEPDDVQVTVGHPMGVTK